MLAPGEEGLASREERAAHSREKRANHTSAQLMLLDKFGAAETRMNEIIPQLSFNGTTANCSVAITGPGKDIAATITLWHGNRVMGSWSGSGTSALGVSGSARVNEGENYVLKVTGSIGGVPFDPVRISRTC